MEILEKAKKHVKGMKGLMEHYYAEVQFRRRSRSSTMRELELSDECDLESHVAIPNTQELPSTSFNHFVESLRLYLMENQTLSRQMTTGSEDHMEICSAFKSCNKCNCVCRWYNFAVTCPVCERFFCRRCYGRGPLSRCLFDQGCVSCQTVVSRHTKFHRFHLPFLEKGCRARMVHSGFSRSRYVLLNFDIDQCVFKFRSLKRKNNVPILKGEVPIRFIHSVTRPNPTAPTICLSYAVGDDVSSQLEEIKFRFGSSDLCNNWLESAVLAWSLLGPEQTNRALAVRLMMEGTTSLSKEQSKDMNVFSVVTTETEDLTV